VDDGVLTPTQVETVLARQREMAARGQQKRFGEIVSEMRLATPEQLQRALDRQQLERT
jgi:hypothetical protein